MSLPQRGDLEVPISLSWALCVALFFQKSSLAMTSNLIKKTNARTLRSRRFQNAMILEIRDFDDLECYRSMPQRGNLEVQIPSLWQWPVALFSKKKSVAATHISSSIPTPAFQPNPALQSDILMNIVRAAPSGATWSLKTAETAGVWLRKWAV